MSFKPRPKITLMTSPGIFFQTLSRSREDYTEVTDKAMLPVFFLGFKGLYGDMDRDPLCHVTDSDCLSLGDSSLLTPIDRLYSMQDSYFTSWEWWPDSVRNGPSPSLHVALWSWHLSLWTMHKVVEEVGVEILQMGRGYTVIPCTVNQWLSGY